MKTDRFDKSITNNITDRDYIYDESFDPTQSESDENSLFEKFFKYSDVDLLCIDCNSQLINGYCQNCLKTSTSDMYITYAHKK